MAIAVPIALAAPPQENKAETYRLLELFGDAFERVRADYVEKVSDEELIEAAIEGMLTHLDPHSAYLNKKSFKEMQVQTKGEFGGLGIEVTMDKGFVKVVSPIDETPAFRAGLQAGDLITHLDTESVQGLTLNEAVERMRGPVGTDIKLTIRRGTKDAFDVTLTRDRIQIRSVRSRTEGQAAYIRITSFSEKTTENLKQAVDQLNKELGDKLNGYILDLRNNPGGLLDQAVSVSDAFLERGEIVSTRGREEDAAQRFQATAGDIAGGKPIVVLINGGSASASEIVAGALQDHRRAILLGTKSFGKGSVQTIIPLNRNGAIKLTTQRYYTPSGRSIQAKGIEPDIMVEQARLERIDAGVQRKEADLRGALDLPAEQPQAAPAKPGADSKAPAGSDKGSNAAPTQAPDAPAEIGSSEDYQLARALDLLRGISLYRTRAVN
ncbi:MAG: S41 family peptidase [Alphaproteobacteria bacterium]